jgi:hypothetical protein
MRLKNRQRPLPNGVAMYCPATKYQAPLFSTFTAQVDGTIAARLANPGVTKQYNLPTDRPTVEKEVDSYLAQVAMRQGWTDLVDTARQPSEGGVASSVPFPNPAQPTRRPSPFERAQLVVAGSEILVDWISSGAEAVPIQLAERRAAVCAKCVLNEPGGLEQFFTLPVAAAIRTALNARREMRLQTSKDDLLHTCGGCLCPLRLMIHVPLEKKLAHLSQDAFDRLDQNCWVRSEKALMSEPDFTP